MKKIPFGSKGRGLLNDDLDGRGGLAEGVGGVEGVSGRRGGGDGD